MKFQNKNISSFLMRTCRWVLRHIRDKREFVLHVAGFIKPLDELKEALKTEHQTLSPLKVFNSLVPVFTAGKDWDSAAIFQLGNKDEAKIIMDEADQICGHIVDLLGSGPVSINKKSSNEIDWHRDQISGEEWPETTFYKFTKTVRRRGADIKWVRELSRGDHLIRLGQAYRLRKCGFECGRHDAEYYAKECIDQILSWIDENPWPWGSNWQCTMDVGLRALNWLLAIDLLSNSEILQRKEVLNKILCSLYTHGTHIYKNPECYPGGITNNHYMADLVAQIVLGLSLSFFEKSDQWVSEGMANLRQEIGKQILPNSSVCFEASTGYHRLDYEMLLWVILVLEAKEKKVPSWLQDCISKMGLACETILKFNGEVPAFGDQDNGRALNLFPRPNLYHAYLKGFMNDSDACFPETIWSLGPRHSDIVRSHEQAESFTFPDVGWHGVRVNGWDLSILCGPVGTAGIGGHSHNDQLSFDLSVDGINLAGDPGTYVYTSWPEERNRFRSTTMHSTIWVEGVEQCEFTSLFSRKCHGRAYLESWNREKDGSYMFSGHFEGPYFHQRRLVVNPNAGFMEGHDTVHVTDGVKNVWWVFILHPGVRAKVINLRHIQLLSKHLSFDLKMHEIQGHYANSEGFTIDKIPYSRGYGSKESAHRIVYPLNNVMECKWAITKRAMKNNE